MSEKIDNDKLERSLTYITQNLSERAKLARLTNKYSSMRNIEQYKNVWKAEGFETSADLTMSTTTNKPETKESHE